jgi:UDP-N-acetylglucosamine 2-epimerase (non-hydrolysing)
MRVLVAFGTRPEAVKCFPVIEALRVRWPKDVTVCVTAQHRASLDQVLELVGIEPDFDLDLMRPAPTLTDITCDVLRGMGEVLDTVRPECVLVQGDTTTAMGTALAALYRMIPVAHIEAGLRTHDILSPWPEEANRRIISVLSSVHFAPTSQARENLLKENVFPERIHVTGNTIIDALHAIERRLDMAGNLDPSVAEVVDRANAAGERLVLVTAHRRENWGEGIRSICDVARRLAARTDVHVVVPVHPNPNVHVPIHQELSEVPGVSLLRPLDYLSFVDLMRRSWLILTDSGGVQEEAPALGKPVLVLRKETERPEGVAAGAAALVGVEPSHVVREAERLLDDEAAFQAMSRPRNIYGDGKAAHRIATILTTQPLHRELTNQQFRTPRNRPPGSSPEPSRFQTGQV